MKQIEEVAAYMREKAWARLYDEAASENAVLKDRIRELEAEDAEATEREPDGRWGAIMAMAEHQVRDDVHPLTCAERGDHPVRYGDKGVLWPALTPGGDPMLVCPDCDYTQEWPHHLPINPDFGDPDADRTERFGIFSEDVVDDAVFRTEREPERDPIWSSGSAAGREATMRNMTLQEWWAMVRGAGDDASSIWSWGSYPGSRPFSRVDSAHYSLYIRDLEDGIDRPDGYRPPRWRVAAQVAREWWLNDVLGSRPLWAIRTLALCVALGRHRMWSDGAAGPESGWERWGCSRCGMGGEHVYY